MVEPVSVDEAYVDISGLERLFGDPASIGAMTRDRVAARVGLGCSVGIGPNRLVAKLASEHGKPGGLVVVPPAGVRAFLDPLPVSALRGVGPGLAQALERVGLHRVADLRRCSPERLQGLFGTAAGASLHRQARGEGSDRVGAGGPRKSISKETTFGRDTADPRRIRQALRWLASELGRALRREGLRGLQLTLKLRLAGFETHTRCRTVRPAVDGDLEIFGHAWRLYRESGHAGRPVRLVGIGLARWEGETPCPDLFDHTPERLRRDALYRTLDQVKERFGRGIIAFGAGEEWR